MKSIKHFLSFLVVLLVLSACSHKPDAVDSQGKPIRLSDYQGKWVVINYWAPWCHPCLQELPAFNALYRSHHQQVVILGVSYDHLPNPEIESFAKKLGIQFSMLSDFPIEKFGVTEISALPMTFIISPQGKLVETLHGPQTEGALLKAMKLS